MSVFEYNQKMGLIPFELKNARNVRTQCAPFVAVITGLTQEEKYAVYEDNYYRLQEYKSLEKELGVELPLFFKIMKTETLWWKDKNKKRTHNIASEFISIKPYISIGGFMMFEFSWNDRNLYNYENCDVIIKEQESPIGMPHIYLYLKASDYGKTWALTKEELE